jgi:hypothetical protein
MISVLLRMLTRYEHEIVRIGARKSDMEGRDRCVTDVTAVLCLALEANRHDLLRHIQFIRM